MFSTAALTACVTLALPAAPVAVSLGAAAGGLVVRFENRGQSDLAVMPALDGSDCRWRFPHYDLELAGPGDVARPFPPGGPRCGNVNQLTARDVVLLRPGEVFQTPVPLPASRLPAGGHRVRLRYTAKRDTTTRGMTVAPEAGVEQAIKTVWEGTAVSNWVDVEIAPKAPAVIK